MAAFIAVQFFRPARNESNAAQPADITNVVPMPVEVAASLKAACYDCHSNNTTYPWYAEIQPGGWYLARHVSKGKAELNFSEFGRYKKRRQANKLKAIANQINDNEMPLASYTWLHPTARLTSFQRTGITSWARSAADSLGRE